MSLTVGRLCEILDRIAPFSEAESFDNCGLIVGDFTKSVTKIGVALDATKQVVQQAILQNVDALVTHHPVWFHPSKQLHADNVIYTLIGQDIACIALHTNLDRATFGTNTVLCELFGIRDCQAPTELDGFGRFGQLEKPIAVSDYAKKIKHVLGAEGVRYLDCQTPCQRVVCVAGSGGSFVDEVLKLGADTLITGDFKHDQIVSAQNSGLNLIEAGHFDAEKMVLPVLANMIAQKTSLAEIMVLSMENPMKFL